MIAAVPHQGGATWAVLQYLLGFRRLGHEVHFVEPIAAQAIRPAGASLESSVNAAYFRDVVRDFGIEECASLLGPERQTVGVSYAGLRELARGADVLVNISGMLTDAALLEPIPVRLYLDLDPAFNQLWHATQGVDMHFDGHTHFVTVGQAIGRPDCPVPTCGRSWLTTLQPVVLEHWPVAGPGVYDALTTIGHWRGYGSIEHAGVFYGQKAHSLRPLIALPRKAPMRLLLAMAIHPGETKDLDLLSRNGWELIDPATVAGTPRTYQRFIQGSRAEFGLAKSGYAVSRCGWLSDRSVAYLASGRPVLAQDTGLEAFMPSGRGLFTFRTEEDVLAAIEQLRGDYVTHARAARELAQEHFDSDRVLSLLLQRTGAG
ncbi:MAG: glycosyltransferase family 1 protein [Candidatus Riflebacteria bacterium]|nr:glycosyltransferase family 1 protein [Candidatus Riflebacteria bacterium]